MSKKILTILGAPDDHQIMLEHSDPESGALRVHISGSHNLLGDIDCKGLDIQQLILGGRSPKQIKRLPKADIVYNGITGADSNTRMLKYCHQLIEQIQPKSVLNAPARVAKTDRVSVAENLQGIEGVIMPRTARGRFESTVEFVSLIQELDLKYPLIIRPVGRHAGIGMQRFDNEAHLLAELKSFDPSHEYYLTEYHDYADSQGIYRKTRIVVVNNKFIPRHCMPSQQWMIHARSREEGTDKHPEWRSFEQKFLTRFDQALSGDNLAALEEINRRIGLTFYGIDCCFTEEGQLLIFEVNPVMQFFSTNVVGNHGIGADYDYLQAQVSKIRKSIRQVFLTV